MKVDEYHLFCSQCEESQFVLVPAKKVKVLCDLHKDEYQFTAKCPECGGRIFNSRRAFK